MDTSQWPQELGLVKPIGDLVSSTITTTRPQVMERRAARPHKEQALNCPRCNSTNTKFCYYNNYNLTQPRYFCKTCRRYWTEGGSLRNVPVGGGSRKNKRPSASASSSSSSSSSSRSSLINTTTIAAPSPTVPSQNPKFHDLNLGYPHHSLPEFMPVMPDARVVYPSGFGLLHDFRPPTTLNFPLQGVHHDHESTGRMMFPFEDLKQAPSSIAEFDQSRGQGWDPPGFWNGLIGAEGSW